MILMDYHRSHIVTHSRHIYPPYVGDDHRGGCSEFGDDNQQERRVLGVVK